MLKVYFVLRKKMFKSSSHMNTTSVKREKTNCRKNLKKLRCKYQKNREILIKFREISHSYYVKISWN